MEKETPFQKDFHGDRIERRAEKQHSEVTGENVKEWGKKPCPGPQRWFPLNPRTDTTQWSWRHHGKEKILRASERKDRQHTEEPQPDGSSRLAPKRPENHGRESSNFRQELLRVQSIQTHLWAGRKNPLSGYMANTENPHYKKKGKIHEALFLMYE